MSKRMKLRHKVLKCAVENMKFAKSFCHGAIGCALMGNTLGYDYDRDKQRRLELLAQAQFDYAKRIYKKHSYKIAYKHAMQIEKLCEYIIYEEDLKYLYE